MNQFAAFKLKPEDSVCVIGAGGHARSVIGVLRDMGCTVEGVLADGGVPGEVWPGIAWLGELQQAGVVSQRFPKAAWVSAVGDNYQRLRIMREIQSACPAARFPAILHPSAVVAADVTIEEGAVVMPGAVVMAGSRLGAGSLLNTRASLDHESTLAEGASLAPGVVTGGRVCIGRRTFVGLGAMVKHGVRIGEDCIVGAGALVLNDLPDRVVAYGSPARVMRSRIEGEPYL